MSIIFKVCKRTIERGNYPEDMLMRINVFYGANVINTEEYNILVSLLTND